MIARLSASAGVMVIVATVAPAVQQRPQPLEPRPTFRSDVVGVTIDVSVRRRNTPVTGLQSDDFELVDNGVAQRVQAVSIEAIPLDISILLDFSGSMRQWVGQLPRSTTAVAKLLGSTDRFRIIGFGSGVHELLGWQGAREPIPLSGLPPYLGYTAVHDALLLAMMHQPDADRRHLMVAFTDAYDTVSVLTANQVADAAQRTEASIHLMHYAPRGSIRPPWNSDVATLEQLVGLTGGRWRTTSGSLPDAFEQVLLDYRSRYLLRYTPTGVAPGGWHEVKVRVPRAPNYTIHSRKGYSGG